MHWYCSKSSEQGRYKSPKPHCSSSNLFPMTAQTKVPSCQPLSHTLICSKTLNGIPKETLSKYKRSNNSLQVPSWMSRTAMTSNLQLKWTLLESLSDSDHHHQTTTMRNTPEEHTLISDGCRGMNLKNRVMSRQRFCLHPYKKPTPWEFLSWH